MVLLIPCLIWLFSALARPSRQPPRSRLHLLISCASFHLLFLSLPPLLGLIPATAPPLTTTFPTPTWSLLLQPTTDKKIPKYKKTYLRKMVGQTKNCEMKQKMQVLKDLYLSRHYTRCAKSGERLLGEVDSSVSKHTRCAFPIDHNKKGLTIGRCTRFTWHILTFTLRYHTTLWRGRPQ